VTSVRIGAGSGTDWKRHPELSPAFRQGRFLDGREVHSALAEIRLAVLAPFLHMPRDHRRSCEYALSRQERKDNTLVHSRDPLGIDDRGLKDFAREWAPNRGRCDPVEHKAETRINPLVQLPIYFPFLPLFVSVRKGALV
jgi:hypothetical protein